MNYNYQESFVFTSLVDFRAENDPDQQYLDANEFGIRIINCNGLRSSDYKVRKGPLFRFRMRVSELITGVDNNCSFFIRRIEVHKDSNLKLYYYDLETKKDAIIEIKRRPGLRLTFCSGKRNDIHIEVDVMHTKKNKVRIMSLGDLFEIA